MKRKDPDTFKILASFSRLVLQAPLGPPSPCFPSVTLSTLAVTPHQALDPIFVSALFAFHSDFHTHAHPFRHAFLFSFPRVSLCSLRPSLPRVLFVKVLSWVCSCKSFLFTFDLFFLHSFYRVFDELKTCLIYLPFTSVHLFIVLITLHSSLPMSYKFLKIRKK